jgi:hypothetical protein
MKIEPRYATDAKGQRYCRGLVIEGLTEAQSKLLDLLFGTRVGEDGLIGTCVVERRLEDGYGQDYLYICKKRRNK